MKKLLSILSLASIATTIFVDPVFARPIAHHGDKGTYTIDFEAGTYRGCLKSGGCIFLGRKYLVENRDPESESTAWTKGEYTYAVGEGEIWVTRNGRTIFEDHMYRTK